MAYRSYALIHEDPHLLIVTKPAGLLVNMAEKREQTLEDQVRAAASESDEYDACLPTTIHRLDRYTSGLVIFGRTKRALSEMGKLVAAGAIKKTYWVLVSGLSADKGDSPLKKGGQSPLSTINVPIKKVKKDLRRAEVSDDEVAQEAITHYKTIEELGDFSLVEAIIETGRTHHLRVHFKYIGAPIGGDGIFGRRKMNGRLNHIGLKRQFIHARELEFTHPITGKQIKETAKLPKDLSRILKELRTLSNP
ncbi:MAG: RluA family pseudouridine synthase [Planctomycetes bacterium]|nr:RluA family pseudouridine synthase [Planctomycetota bacterium]